MYECRGGSGKLDCLPFFGAEGNSAGSDGLRESNRGFNEIPPVESGLIFVLVVTCHKCVLTARALASVTQRSRRLTSSAPPLGEERGADCRALSLPGDPAEAEWQIPQQGVEKEIRHAVR